MKDNIFKHIKNQTVPVQLFQKQFDTGQYIMAFTIFNMSQKINDVFCIQSQQFKKLIIRNTLDNFYPQAIFQFIDFNGIYTSKVNTNGEYLKIVVMPPMASTQDTQQSKAINMIFSIQNHNIVAQIGKEVHYKLQCKFWTARNFAMHVPFSTYINPTQSNMLTPYQIIKRMMKKINYPIEEIPPCKQKIYYISDQNNTVLDDIKYCLQYGCAQGEIPSYICHNILQDKPVFINRDLPKKQDCYKVNFNLQMVTAAGTNQTDKSLVIFGQKIFSANRTLSHYQQKALDIGWKYNQNQRKWTQQIITPNKIDQELTQTTQQVKNLKTSFFPETYNESNIRHYRYSWEMNIYDKFKDLQLGTNNIQFNVVGNILREVGQMVNIQSKQVNFKNAYSGFWRIYSILHIFQDQKYINNIVGYRTITLNNKEDEDKKG